MQFVWLGHATVYMKNCNGTRVLVDAWVDTNLACNAQLTQLVRSWGIDVIVLTHGHSDHCADVAALQHDTGAIVCCQYDAQEWLTYQNIPPAAIRAFNKGGTVTLGDLRITMTAAAHSNSWPTAAGARTLGNEVGYVLRTQGDVTVYAAGDTAVMADMAIIADLYQPHVALLPIGDKYTMGPYEAAYATKLIQPQVVLPIHYATFPDLSGTPDLFRTELLQRGVSVQVLAPAVGEWITWSVNS